MSPLEQARIDTAKVLRDLAATFTDEQLEQWRTKHPRFHPDFLALINAMGTVTSETVEELSQKLAAWVHVSPRWFQSLSDEQKEIAKKAQGADEARRELAHRRHFRIQLALAGLDVASGSLVTVAGFVARLPGAIFVPLALALLVMLSGAAIAASGRARAPTEHEHDFARRGFPYFVGSWIVLGVLGMGCSHIVAAVIWGALGSIALNKIVHAFVLRDT